MPAFVEEALREADLFSDYFSRPEYQRNDYLGWINHAKKTKRKESVCDRCCKNSKRAACT